MMDKSEENILTIINVKTAEHQGIRTMTFVLDWDATVDEWRDTFASILVAMTFTPDQIDEVLRMDSTWSDWDDKDQGGIDA
jgi:hypothetical protein